MKKIVIIAVLCFFLTGCSSQSSGIQAYYAGIETAQMQAQVLVHLSEDDRAFGVACSYDRENGTTTTITEPAELKGLSATVKGEELSLAYDGSVWPAGDGGTLSAANCLPLLLQAAAEGYVTQEGKDRIDGAEYLRLGTELTAYGETFAATLWAQPEGFAPYAAELSRDGEVLITIHFTQFTCERKQA